MNKKTFNLIVNTLSALLGLLVIVNLYCAVYYEQPLLQAVITILLSTTSLLAVFYISAGYTKLEGAKYFHMFMITYAITTLFLLILNRSKDSIITFSFNLVIYGCFCVLASAKDLGESNSTKLAAIILTLSILTFIFGFDNTSLTLLTILFRCQILLTSIASFLMVKAKYRDKKERGSK